LTRGFDQVIALIRCAGELIFLVENDD